MSNDDWEVNWNFWLNMPTVKIWQACALSLDIDPDKMTGSMECDGWQFYPSSFRTIKEKDDFDKRCRLLTKIAFNNENIRSTEGIRVLSINHRDIDSEIYLGGFPEWALSIKWDIPKELKTPVTTKEKIKDKPNKDLWLIPRDSDPESKLPWHISARYFARKLVKDDPTLLTKRSALCIKVAASLAGVGLYKRGGKKPYDPQTIRKELIKIKFD